MSKTLLITGATDGIGFETAKQLHALGHRVWLHGRSAAKLEAAAQALGAGSDVRTFHADLSDLEAARRLAAEVAEATPTLDVLINNAGVYNTPEPRTPDGLDRRFVVNTLAPYLLARALAPVLGATGRIVNLSSAAQSPVDLDALRGQGALSDSAAYAQSKLAITMWSRALATEFGPDGPVILAVNPGSMLASKMVKEAYGVAGHDLSIGADILTRAALEDAFAARSGEYFDNDAGQFAPPHPQGLDDDACAAVVRTIESVLA